MNAMSLGGNGPRMAYIPPNRRGQPGAPAPAAPAGGRDAPRGEYFGPLSPFSARSDF